MSLICFHGRGGGASGGERHVTTIKEGCLTDRVVSTKRELRLSEDTSL